MCYSSEEKTCTLVQDVKPIFRYLDKKKQLLETIESKKDNHIYYCLIIECLFDLTRHFLLKQPL
jgi:hypothetical protein